MRLKGGGIIRQTKSYGLVTGAEHYMLIHAEHTYERLHPHKKGAKAMPRVRRCRYPGCHTMVTLPDHYCAKHYEHEAEYLAKRQRWARSHQASYQHKYNQVTRNRNKVKRAQYQFYQSKEWQSLRQQALDRDHYVCQYCGQPNSNTVDHTIPIEYDPSKTTELSNLATVCRQCHRAKTDWEHGYYGTGQGQTLKKVAPLGVVALVKQAMREIHSKTIWALLKIFDKFIESKRKIHPAPLKIVLEKRTHCHHLKHTPNF